MDSTFIQIFLLLNVFLAGALAVIAAQHAYAHFRPHQSEPKKAPETLGGHLPSDVKGRLIKEAETTFQAALRRSAEELHRDLTATNTQLAKQLDKLGTETIDAEMQRYRAQLERLRQQVETTLGGAQGDIEKHQTDLRAQLTERQNQLEAKLSQDIETEKQQLVSRMDAKLGDAMASFLVEALGHEVDLGAQSAYLTTMLEKHKADIIKGVRDES